MVNDIDVCEKLAIVMISVDMYPCMHYMCNVVTVGANICGQ